MSDLISRSELINSLKVHFDSCFREDESAEYYKNLRCVAWQPLPEPYKN